MNTKEIKETLEKHSIYPNKKLGQNFLCNEGILKKIIEAANINKNDHVLEIGPGLGDLTYILTEKAGKVTSVEIDSGLYKFLKARFCDKWNLVLIHEDFLKANIRDIFSKAISNLPYYCASEILFHLAEKYMIKEIFVMLQKEMCERIISQPGTKIYGALTVTLGFYYESSVLFNIDRKSFYPQPDVASSFLYLRQKETLDLSPDEILLFHKIVKSLFWGRRKTIKKGLSESPHLKINKEIIKIALEESNIDENTRGENLSVEEFIKITRTIYRFSAGFC